MKKNFKVGDYVKLGKTIMKVIDNMPRNKATIMVEEINRDVRYVISRIGLEKISEEEARLYAL